MLIRYKHLDSHKLKPYPLETLDNLSHEGPLYSIGFEYY
jgi:hypothetical protein